MKTIRLFLIAFFILAIGLVQSCNYNYYRGMELEKEERYEEANIEFQRAYTKSPGNTKFRDAYLRTAIKTTEDLLERYDKYLGKKKYLMAFRRLEQARGLTPDHPRILSELKKWYRILLAGKVDLVKIQSLNNQIPLTDQIVLEIHLNTPNITRRLEAPIDYQTRIFSIEDVLYDPPQNLLMLYSINSIGVKLVNNSIQSGISYQLNQSSDSARRAQFKKFIDFKIPVLVDVQGALNDRNKNLTPVDKFYPSDLLKHYKDSTYWYPSSGIRYSLELKDDVVRVKSSVDKMDFLPQILYINKKDRRYFLDFGHLQLAQRKMGGLWTFRRTFTEKREYMQDLQNNLILHPYFYYREGGYPFVPFGH